jgi:hypothetical protein
MINVGEVYYDTLLETLFIVDAISNVRVYLVELKEKIDPRVVIEKPGTIFERYKLTNIGKDILANENWQISSQWSVEKLADVNKDAAPYTYELGGNEHPIIAKCESPIVSKTPVKAKAKPGRKPVKKVIKKRK